MTWSFFKWLGTQLVMVHMRAIPGSVLRSGSGFHSEPFCCCSILAWCLQISWVLWSLVWDATVLFWQVGFLNHVLFSSRSSEPFASSSSPHSFLPPSWSDLMKANDWWIAPKIEYHSIIIARRGAQGIAWYRWYHYECLYCVMIFSCVTMITKKIVAVKSKCDRNTISQSVFWTVKLFLSKWLQQPDWLYIFVLETMVTHSSAMTTITCFGNFRKTFVCSMQLCPVAGGRVTLFSIFH